MFHTLNAHETPLISPAGVVLFDLLTLYTSSPVDSVPGASLLPWYLLCGRVGGMRILCMGGLGHPEPHSLGGGVVG